MNGIRTLAIAAGLALGVSAAPADSSTLRYTGIHFFGDSLVDPENLAALAGSIGLPFPAAFPLGKASDGPLWSELIAAEFAAAGLRTGNYAFASAQIDPDGAPVPLINLPSQLLRFVAATPAPLPGNDLAVFWIGNNDMLGLIEDADLTPEGGLTAGDQAALGAQAAGLAGTLVSSAALLSTLGIEDFVFLKLPDFGLIPRFTLLDPVRVGVASLGAGLFNGALEEAVAGLGATGLRAGLFDFDSALRGALADPGALGVTQPILPCLAVIGATPAIADLVQCSQHFFYDDIHPTSTLHAELAREFRGVVAVAPVPLPAAGWLLLVALAGLGGLARAGRRA
jgi:phospholipase/lecithinase/hemolysin